MNKIQFAILIILLSTRINSADIVQKNIGGKNLLVISLEFDIIIELRSTYNEKLLDELIISSRINTPTFKFKDIIQGNGSEMIIFVNGGGSGLSVVKMIILVFEGKKIYQTGEFYLSYDQFSVAGADDLQIEATIDFNGNGKIFYNYKETIYKTGESEIISSNKEIYTYNKKKHRFIKDSN